MTRVRVVALAALLCGPLLARAEDKGAKPFPSAIIKTGPEARRGASSASTSSRRAG